jgi:hypothetical protein
LTAVVAVGAFCALGIYYTTSAKPKTVVPAETAAAPAPAQVPTASGADEHFFAAAELRGISEASIPGGECSLDYLAQDDKKIVSKGNANIPKKAQFYGWGVVDGKLPSAYFLEMKPVAAGAPSFYAKLGEGGVERKDVVDVMKRPELLKSGFYAEGGFTGLSGTYDLFLLMRSAKSIYQCSLNFQLVLSAG